MRPEPQEKGETNHRHHKHSPWKRRNGGMPVGYSERIALREQCSMQTLYWVMTSNQTTKQYSLLGNIFLRK
jgi:hypothetical protein